MLYNVTESTLPKPNMVLQKVSQIGKCHLMSDNAETVNLFSYQAQYWCYMFNAETEPRKSWLNEKVDFQFK